MTLERALRTMLSTADALCVQASERDRDRAAHLTARFDDALGAFIDAGGDHQSTLVQVRLIAVKRGSEWMGQRSLEVSAVAGALETQNNREESAESAEQVVNELE